MFSPRSALALAAGLLVAAAPLAQAPAGLVLGDQTTQTVEFTAGPNLVSLRVYPADRSLDAVFGDQIDNVLFAKDGQGNVYAPRYGALALTQWPADQALSVFTRTPFSLEVAGAEILETSVLALGEGWSSVPMFAGAALSAEQVFGPLGDALSVVKDGDGRAYPAQPGEPALTTVEPGRGYRLHLAASSSLSYGSDRSVVPTVVDALAMEGFAVGDEIEIQGFRTPGDGGGGILRVTESGCAPDGGTCFVPTAHTQEAPSQWSTTSIDLAGSFAQWESLRLCHDQSGTPVNPALTVGDGCYTALQLHGHGARNDGRPLLDPTTGVVTITFDMREYARTYGGDDSGRHDAQHRFATSDLRLERVVNEPLVLEGVATTAYTRPEWWGGRPGVGDATDAVAWAIEAAKIRAQATGTDHYAVLSGMYGYSRVLETRTGVVIKGAVDGVREGQGLRVVQGAPWHYFATKNWVSDPAYKEPETERDAFLEASKVHVRHGRQTMFARVVDVEIDGNLAQNDYIFSPEYEEASGPAGNPQWPNRVREITRNTTHYNGFIGSNDGDTLEDSNARLENVYIHGFGGNGLLSNNWTHFGGSRDLRIGDIVNNHSMYGVPTSTGWIDGIEISGFFWKAAITVNSGNYRNVSYTECEENPYGDPLESIFDIRNSNPTAAEIGQGGTHHFGEEVVVDGLEVVFTDTCQPRNSYGVVQYTRGPATFRNVDATGGDTERYSLIDDRSAADNGSEFTLENVHLTGDVVGLSGIIASRQRIRNVTSSSSFVPNDEMFVFRPQPGVDQVVTVYDVDLDVRVPRLFKVWPQGSTANTSFRLYVRDASFEADDPVQLVGAPTDTRIYYRRTELSDWDDELIASGREWFDDVTVTALGGRASEASGSHTYTAAGGETWVAVQPGLFHAPTSAGLVQVSNVRSGGAPAPSLYAGTWSAVGDTYDPVLTLNLARPLTAGETITFDWAAAVRPIPGNVVFPE